jgi:DNA-binding GntR family transcriptional regulator
MKARRSAADWPGEPERAPDPGPLPDGSGLADGSVLANRLAAALVHHEPGWRLPRHTALARRYNVSPAEIEHAVTELVSRHLVRRLPDGQLYRTSPAEYLIEMEGVAGLGSTIDPMGGDLACRSRQVSWRRVPEDIAWALGLPAAVAAVCVVRFLWTVGGEPAASSTTYLPSDLAASAGLSAEATLPASLSLLPLALAEPPAPRALHIEMQPPPPAVARSLRLAAGQPATIVTVRFDDAHCARPVALTVAVLRSDLFRVVVQSPQLPLGDAELADGELADAEAGSYSGAWTHAVED